MREAKRCGEEEKETFILNPKRRERTEEKE